VGFFGDPRQGKTLSMVAEVARILRRENRTVYSNIRLNFPYVPLTPQNLIDAVDGKFKFDLDSILVLDEIYLNLLESRRSMSGDNVVVTWFLMQTGKMGSRPDSDGCLLLYTAQYPELVDSRLWMVTSIKIFTRKFNFRGHPFILQIGYHRRIFGLQKSVRVIDPTRFYDLYDTRERVMSIARTSA
jgi:hypothetical protein